MGVLIVLSVVFLQIHYEGDPLSPPEGEAAKMLRIFSISQA